MARAFVNGAEHCPTKVSGWARTVFAHGKGNWWLIKFGYCVLSPLVSAFAELYYEVKLNLFTRSARFEVSMTDKPTVSDKTDVAQKDTATDPSAGARTEAETLMKDSTAPVAAKLDTSVWPDVGFAFADARPSGPKPGPAEPRAEQKAQPGQSPKVEKCDGNEAFQTLIDTAASLIYDPKDLGDLNKLYEQNACVPTTAEAVKRADDALKVAKDPYTDILPAKEANDLRTAMNGHLIGVGVQIGRAESAPGKEPLKAGPIQIQRVYPNSPAEAAGLKRGDMITSVGGVDVSKMSPDDVAAKLLRGAEGTDAKIHLLRDGKPMDFTMKRADYSFPSVTDSKIGDYAYIRLEDLGQNDSADELKAALEKHQDAKGFVLDLRDNPGGLVPNALLAASLIMEKGEILKVRSRVESDPSDPQYNVERYFVTPTGIKATTENPNEQIGDQEDVRMKDLVNKPLVVLTNEGTASAAEILAGALHDNKEAVLIGNTTFGKGIGQQVLDGMPDDSILKVTNFRFFTPNGQWIGDGHDHRTGIAPDIKVENPKSAEYGSPADAQLKAGLKKLDELTGKN
jgi:carboxyl-terminal processing protease